MASDLNVWTVRTSTCAKAARYLFSLDIMKLKLYSDSISKSLKLIENGLGSQRTFQREPSFRKDSRHEEVRRQRRSQWLSEALNVKNTKFCCVNCLNNTSIFSQFLSD